MIGFVIVGGLATYIGYKLYRAYTEDLYENIIRQEQNKEPVEFMNKKLVRETTALATATGGALMIGSASPVIATYVGSGIAYYTVTSFAHGCISGLYFIIKKTPNIYRPNMTNIKRNFKEGFIIGTVARSFGALIGQINTNNFANQLSVNNNTWKNMLMASRVVLTGGVGGIVALITSTDTKKNSLQKFGEEFFLTSLLRYLNCESHEELTGWNNDTYQYDYKEDDTLIQIYYKTLIKGALERTESFEGDDIGSWGQAFHDSNIIRNIVPLLEDSYQNQD